VEYDIVYIASRDDSACVSSSTAYSPDIEIQTRNPIEPRPTEFTQSHLLTTTTDDNSIDYDL
jgi:hypothetical protein